MRRFLSPFALIFTAIVAVVYVYVASRVADHTVARLVLALPFLALWLVPMIYWVGDREKHSSTDDLVHYVGFLCMGWLSFTLVSTILRDIVWGIAHVTTPDALPTIERYGGVGILAVATSSLILGLLNAIRGPRLAEVEVKIEGLPAALDGLKIAQISDLHVGPTIRHRYVTRVAQLVRDASPDLVALTGDIVDGPVARLAPHVEPLATLAQGPLAGRIFFITGNHEYYAGAAQWVTHFSSIGIKPLLNEHAIVMHEDARLLVGGVVDPAVRMEDRDARPDAQRARGQAPADFTLLLAHNPKLAKLGATAGFDLMLSGHTHAGQFHPWTFVAKAVHAPHFAGLSREGKMHVYVSPGTGSWGPPVRFGTSPEVTVLTLRRKT